MATWSIILLTIIFIIISLGLCYLIYNIFKSKLLFKSALKSSYKSAFALISLILLYTITFSLWSASIMFKDVMVGSTDNLVAQTNFHQVTINSDKERGSENPNIIVNRDKWVDELGPTMEELHPGSIYAPFDNWINIEEQILSQDDDIQLPGEYTGFESTFYYKEFLDIWMYQNEHYQGNNKQTLPYINFGYNEVATLDLVIPAKVEGGDDFNARAVRMNPIDRGVVAPIPNMDEDEIQTPNQLLLKEGELPDANDSLDGTDKENPVEIGITKSFAEAQNYPIGSTIHAKAQSDDFVGSPIDHSNIYGEVTGFVEHSALTFFNVSNIDLFPNFSEQTLIALPYDAFNRMAQSISGVRHPKYEINITFTDDAKYLKDGGSVEDFGSTRSEENQDEFIKVMSAYFRKSKVEFYGEVGNTPEENQSALDKTIAFKWSDPKNYHSSGIQMVYIWSETNSKVNIIINSVFVSINMIFIFMVLRRKAVSESKQIGTFKALGYSSKQMASSFTINIFIIVFFGGLLSLLFAFPLVSWFEGLFITNSIATEMLATKLSFSIIMVSIILPLILISLAVWTFIWVIIKKPVTSLMNDTSLNKPNFLVRGSTVITRHLSFTRAYATKNGIRAIGKSVLTFTTIFFSTTLLLFGVLVSGFADKASESTLGLMNYESQSYATDKVVSLNKEEIDAYGNNYDDDANGTDYSYDFGVNFNYKTYGPTTNIDAYQNITGINIWDKVFPTGYDETNLKHRFKAWQQEIVYYMRSTEVHRDKTYIDVLDKDFIDSFINTSWLYFELLINGTEDEKELVTQDLKFITASRHFGRTEVQILKGVTLEQILSTMSMFIVSGLDLENLTNNKIIFDIHETSTDEESLFKETETFLNKINGEQQPLGDSNELKWTYLYSGARSSFESGVFDLKSWHWKNDLNKKLLEYQNDDPNVFPVVIDYPTSKLFKLKEGDIVELIYPYEDDEILVEVPTLQVEIIGIYEAYFSLPWFGIGEDPALIKYLEEVDMYQTEQLDTNAMWYANSNEIGMNDVNNLSFRIQEETNNKTYSCMSSRSFLEPTFFFVGGGDKTPSSPNNIQGNRHPITSMAPCFSVEIPTEAYVTMSEDLTSVMDQMLIIFVGFAYMIVFIILLVISNETIQGSKREVSTLKALGYKTRTMSKIVLLGQSLIMVLSIFIALPLTLIVLNLITNLLLTKAGIFFDLTPNLADLAIVIGVVIAIIIIMYIIGLIVYKYTSSLDSLQRDA